VLNHDVVVVVQARTGSTRLPGKVLADLHGRPMLGFQLDRLARLSGGQVVVATSDKAADDAIADVAASRGVAVVRGPELDVLARFGHVIERYPADTIVRLTGDCPLVDPEVVSDAVRLHLRAEADYTSNVLPRSFPKGLDVEVVAVPALREAISKAEDPAEREHVTPYVYRRPERFRLANLACDEPLGDESWTVDTAEDLAEVRRIVARVPEPDAASWREILGVAGRRHAPVPGEVRLRPGVPPSPGDAPWRREWIAEVDGSMIGIVAVSVGFGRVQREVDVDEPYGAMASTALERMLVGDQQSA
jgi:spore coat polysaccharide biosynthesis protein SpsF